MVGVRELNTRWTEEKQLLAQDQCCRMVTSAPHGSSCAAHHPSCPEAPSPEIPAMLFAFPSLILWSLFFLSLLSWVTYHDALWAAAFLLLCSLAVQPKPFQSFSTTSRKVSPSVIYSLTSYLCFPRPWKCLLKPKQGQPGVVTEFLKLDSTFFSYWRQLPLWPLHLHFSLAWVKVNSSFLRELLQSQESSIPFIFWTSRLFPWLWMPAAWRSYHFIVGVSSSAFHWKFPESWVGVGYFFIPSTITGTGLV